MGQLAVRTLQQLVPAHHYGHAGSDQNLALQLPFVTGDQLPLAELFVATWMGQLLLQLQLPPQGCQALKQGLCWRPHPQIEAECCGF